MWLRIEISWNYKCCSSTFVSYSDQQTLTLDKQALMKLPRLYEAVIPRYKKLYRAALSCFQSKEKLTKTAANCFGEVSCKAPSINSSQAFSQCSGHNTFTKEQQQASLSSHWHQASSALNISVNHHMTGCCKCVLHGQSLQKRSWVAYTVRAPF